MIASKIRTELIEEKMYVWRCGVVPIGVNPIEDGK